MPSNEAERNGESTKADNGGPPGFDPRFAPVAEAKRLLRVVRSGMLATLQPDGAPLATLVNVATDADGAPLLLVSALSGHTRNLDREPRVSLLLPETGKGDPLAHPRLTVQGRARLVDRESDEGARIRRRFLARHPKSALYADFGDFSFRRIEPDAFHLNGGFARAADPDVQDVLTSLDGAGEIVAIEEDAVAHMNDDHADALALYAVMFCGMKPAKWRATGIDPEGLDLALGDITARLVFPERVLDGGMLRRVLARMAKEAREQNAAGPKAADGV